MQATASPVTAVVPASDHSATSATLVFAAAETTDVVRVSTALAASAAEAMTTTDYIIRVSCVAVTN
jgi:hypothetical protein